MSDSRPNGIQKRFTQAGHVHMTYLLNEGFESLERERIERHVLQLIPEAVNAEGTSIVAAEEWLQIEHFRHRSEDFANDFHLSDHTSGALPLNSFTAEGAENAERKRWLGQVLVGYRDTKSDLSRPNFKDLCMYCVSTERNQQKD